MRKDMCWMVQLSLVMMLLGCERGAGQSLACAGILATDARIAHVRHQLERGSPHHHVVVAALRDRVASEDLDRFERTEKNWNYARSYLAQSAAFLYRLEQDQRHADLAYRTLRAVYDDPDPDRRLPESGQHGLSRATVGLGFALAYAWCREAWTDEQQAFVRSALHRKLDMWLQFRHVNLFSQRVSNWVAVCRGSELITILALGEQKARSERYEFLIAELSRHIVSGFDGIGATQEGIGYADYGSVFLLPAIIASADAGDDRLIELLHRESKRLYLKAAYGHSAAAVPGGHRLAGRNLTLFSGVGGMGAGNQGWGSLLLAVTPPEDLPYVRWWYDRTFGLVRPGQGGHITDIEPFRQAAIWALLFYPPGNASSPEGHWPLMISGDKGRHYIRRRWRDGRDVQLNIHGQTTFHPQAWAMVELGQWSLCAYGRMLVGGPRLDRSGHQHSMLLVDGGVSSRRDLGRVSHRHQDETTAWVTIDGHDHYHHLGIDQYQRHLLAHFSDPDDNDAVLVLYDRIDAFAVHDYRWGMPIVDEGLEIVIDNDRSLPQLIVRSPEGGALTAWLVSPTEAHWRSEDGLVSFAHHGDSAELLVAISLREDERSEIAVIKHDVTHRHLRIDGTDVVHDRLTDRLLVDEDARSWSPPGQIPPVQGLEVSAEDEQRISLRWWNRVTTATQFQIQGRTDPEQAFSTMRTVSADTTEVALSDLEPGTSYQLRVLSTGADDLKPSSSVVRQTTTWDAGQRLVIEDFAPRDADDPADLDQNNLGRWQAATQDRGWRMEGHRGSGRGAIALDGLMRTSGRVRRGSSNALYLDTIVADVAGVTAALEIDVICNGTVLFAPMVRLTDGRWLRSQQMTSIYARNHWHSQRWDFAAIDVWVELDIDSVSSGETVNVGPEGLAQITGIGVYAHWDQHQAQARIDQVHLYARDIRVTGDQ